MTSRLIVSSNLIVDDIVLPGQAAGGTYPGGAVLWAAIGARTAAEFVTVHAGVGPDFEELFGVIFDRLGLSRDGLAHLDAPTIRSRLVYEAEDRRTETPVHGPDHFARMQVSLSSVPAGIFPVDGTYIFRDLWPDYWRDVARLRVDLGTILWELQGDAARPEDLTEVSNRLAFVDILSLNRAEAMSLTSAVDSSRALDRLLACGAKAVVLREGADGAIIATSSERFRVLPPPGPVIDVTGGGNAFSGGFLAGFVAHAGNLERAAQAGAAAAAIVLRQFGVPDAIDQQDAARTAWQASIAPHLGA